MPVIDGVSRIEEVRAEVVQRCATIRKCLDAGQARYASEVYGQASGIVYAAVEWRLIYPQEAGELILMLEEAYSKGPK